MTNSTNLQGLSIEEIKILMQMLKSDTDNIPDLNEAEVKTVQSGMYKLHQQVMFHTKSWYVDSPNGGGLHTIDKASGETRFKENVSKAKKDQIITMYEEYRGKKVPIAIFPKEAANG